MQLNYRALGSGFPVVVAHGLFGSASNWHSVAHLLSKHFRVLTVDMRNHGDSPHHEQMDYAAMASDLKAVIDSHCEGHAFVIGHSMGGKAAMYLALTHAQQVPALAVVDVAPVAYGRGHLFSRYIAAMQAIPLADIRDRQGAERYLEETVPEIATRRFLLHNLRKQPQGWRWRPNLPVLAASLATIANFPSMERQRAYRAPTLFLRGAHSDYIVDAYWPTIEQLFPAATLTTIDHAGHWLHAEQPNATGQALLDFFTHCQSAAPTGNAAV